MHLSGTHTDEAILRELGLRLSQARLNRNMSQAQLAEQAGVSKRTVERAEKDGAVQLPNLVRILRGLGLVESLSQFIPPPPPSPIEQLERQGKSRQRASAPSENIQAKGWTWGDEQ
jgi:transcriptional regulator with XRE-family HTH domain